MTESVSDSDGDLLALAVETAREAGRLVVAMRERGVDVAGTKSSPIDVVTEADQACEDLIRERLLGARPDDGFIGEEGDDIGGTSGVQWIVDPIDGTVNYLYGLPHYAVSIAAARGDEIVAGVVLSPADGLEYAATLGAGRHLQRRTPRGTADRPASTQALIATGFGYETAVRERQADAVARMLPQVRDIRRRGSCALDLCAVAAGQLDAYVEEGPHIWDYAAGGLVAHRGRGDPGDLDLGRRARPRGVRSGGRLARISPSLVRSCGFLGDGS